MRTLKKKTKTRTVIFATTVLILMGVVLTLVIEDAANVPTSLDGKIDVNPELIKDIFLSEWSYQTIRDFLLEHPDWAEAIGRYILEHVDVTELLKHLTLEELQQLCEMFPGLEEYLGPMLLSMLGNIGDGAPLPEPEVSVPELIAAAAGAIDNGMLGEDDPEIPLFTVDSHYEGNTYIRSVSYGDYDPMSRRFRKAPDFDGTGYVCAPSLFPSQAALGQEPYTLTFHLNGHRDFGTLVGDVSAGTYLDWQGVHQFDPDAENRVWLINADEYRLSFYPDFDYDHAFIADDFVRRNERKYQQYVRQNYLEVPSSQKEMLQHFIDENEIDSPDEAVELLQTTYTYAYKAMDCPFGQDMVEYFLYAKKAGTCTNFASALTLICRQLGVPARFVQGYLPPLEDRLDNLVTTKYAHAWTEIYVPGIGWKRIDGTPNGRIREIDPTVLPDGDVYASDPASRDAKEGLMTVYTTQDLYDDLYLRNVAFGPYDSSTGEFALAEEDDPEGITSLDYYKNYVTGAANYLSVVYENDFSPFGMLTANYSDLVFDEDNIYDSDRFFGLKEFVPVGDRRFGRLTNLYVQRFFPDVDFRGPAIYDEDYLPYLEDNYPTEVPPEFEPAVSEYLSKTGIKDPAALEKSLRERHIHRISAVDGSIPDFLNGSHVGTNQLFAASMVMLCNGLGYHARYVEGYRYEGPMYANSPVTLDENDLHYWVEVYYRGYGWKRFDPTPEPDEADPSIYTELRLGTITITYDGLPHLPTLDDILVTCPDLDLKDPTFADWCEKCLRKGDKPVLEFLEDYGEGLIGNPNVRNEFHLKVQFKIYDQWGQDATKYYPGLDEGTTNWRTFARGCRLIILPSEESSEGGSSK